MDIHNVKCVLNNEIKEKFGDVILRLAKSRPDFWLANGR